MTSSLWKPALAEAVGTFTLIFIGAGSIIADQLSGGRAGLAGVALAVRAGGVLTGAAMNPARAFGRAVFSGTWKSQIRYWVGPLLGGALVALLYEAALART